MKSYIRDVLMKLLFSGDEASYIRLIKARQYLLKTLPEAYENSWRNNRCVFVLSTGRVGTMQLTALLNLSPEVLAFHEPSPVLLKAGADAYLEGCEREKWNHYVHAARDELIAFANHQRKIYVETNNRLTFLTKALANTFPSSKFIHLHRHPFEVIRSGMRRKWYNGDPLDYFRLRPRAGDPLEDSWNKLSPLEKNAWNWTRTNDESRNFIQSLEDSRGFELPANELFNADLERISSLFDFIGASMPPAKRIRGTLARKLNAQRKGEFPTSERWSVEQRAAIQKIVGPVAQELGYEV